MQEQWTRWEPIEGLSKKYFIDSITDNIDEGFKVVFSDSNDDEKKTIQMIFKDNVASYRNINESYVYKTIIMLKKTYGRDFYGDWTFFKVTNSNYLKMLSEESYTLSDGSNFIHFSFMLGDNMLDIIASYEPEVTFVNVP